MEIFNQNNPKNDQKKDEKNLKPFVEAKMEIVVCEPQDIVTVSCLAAGTRITMMDGSVRKIENLREGDFVLTFDHETGVYAGNKIVYAYKGDAPKCAYTLSFENGTELSVVGGHDLFEEESRRYVTLTFDNAESFIGKHFYSVSENAYVALSNVTFKAEKTDFYELYTEHAFNCIANGMLNVADDIDFILNLYTFDENRKADPRALAADIETFGYYAFADGMGYTEEFYHSWNMRYLRIAVGKGLTSWDRMFVQNRDYNCATELAERKVAC